jgi:SAM-dependent methyltransferase
MSQNIPQDAHINFETIKRCRICNSSEVELVLDLGEQPPANSLFKKGDEAPSRVPLRLGRCDSCGTIQLLETINPEQLFLKYVWLTQTAKTAVEYADVFASRIERILNGRKCSILEVGSNDGTFLKAIAQYGHKVLGVDPAQNIGDVARESGVPTISEFFSEKLAEKLIKDYGKFDVVVARNVLPHVSDLHSVIAGVRDSLASAGIAVFEFHRADMILKELHYDSIYHEHLYLHSLNSIENIASQYGLLVFDVDESPISGGSYVAYFAAEQRVESDSLKSARENEASLKINSLSAWQNFSILSTEHIRQFQKLVLDSVSAGKKIIGFGASARSSTLLNAAGLDYTHISVIADNNQWKQGLFTPGSEIQIISAIDAFNLKPDVVVLLAWNFKQELFEQLRALGFQGDVIVPLPGMPHIEKF